MHSEREYIEQCKSEISRKFGLQGKTLSERDYVFLHNKVQERTRVDLSTTTLRRIWTDRYQNVPQIKTLDALAQVLEHSGWHEFKLAYTPDASRKSGYRLLSLKSTVLIVLAVGAIALLLAVTNQNQDKPTVTFRPEKKLHMGVPATIGFHYTIEGNSTDSIEIELSWNPYERQVLDPTKSFYTGTYYYPDYHAAKLLLRDEILALENIHITTPGWYGLVMKAGFDSNPIALPKHDFLTGSRLGFKDDLASKYHLESNQVYYPVFTLSNTDLDSISGDNFSATFKVELSPTTMTANCRQCDFLIKGTFGNIRIPLSQTGCYGLTTVRASEKVISGKSFDLSGLAIDIDTVQSILVENVDKTLNIHTNNLPPLQIEYNQEIGPVKVIKFILSGPGKVLDLSIKNNDTSLSQ